MTEQDALNWLNGGWRSDKYAKTIASAGGLGIDQDGLYGFQCKDFANAYGIYLGAPLPAGNAIVLLQVVPDGWNVVQEDPQPGDLAVRHYIGADGLDYGDVCAVLQSLGNNKYNFIGQNQTNVSLTIGHVPTTFIGTKQTFNRYLRRVYNGSMYTIKPIEPDLVRQHLANFTDGIVQVKATDVVCQNRTEFTDENLGGEFWKGLNFQQKDIIHSLNEQVATLQKQLEDATGEYEIATVYVKKAKKAK